MSDISNQFPQYMMIVNGRKVFMTMDLAGQVFNGNWSRVEIGGLVLEYEDSNIVGRDITPEERERISRIADRISANK